MTLLERAKRFCKSIGDELLSDNVDTVVDRVNIRLPNGHILNVHWHTYRRLREKLIKRYGTETMLAFQNLFTYESSLRQVSACTGIPKSTVQNLFNRTYVPYSYAELLADKKEFFNKKLDK